MAEQHERRLLVFLLLVAVALALAIVRPFWEALFLAAVVAAALRRPMDALARGLRGRRALAAAILTAGVLVVAVLPLAGLGAILVGQVADGVRWLREAIQSGGVQGLVARLPAPAQRAAKEIVDALPQTQHQLYALATGKGTEAAVAVGGVLAATGTVLFQTAMMLIGLFFFLSDGARLVAWLDRQVPLRAGHFRSLVNDFRQTTVSVLVASIGTAGIQALTGLVGYLVAGAPNKVFLTLATFVLALVPAVGGTVVIAGVGLLLVATGRPVAGLFLVAWGLAVVAIVDNVARPLFLKGGMALHGGLVFFALLGGLAVFGAIGLLVGPLALTFLVAVLNLYRREFGREEPGEPPA